MAINPLGYQCVWDGGNPRIITAKAQGAITGGQFVFCSGAGDVVSSGATSFVYTDLTANAGGSGTCFNGIAIKGATSGLAVAIATRGVVIVPAGGTVVNGTKVVPLDGDSVTGITAAGSPVTQAMIQSVNSVIGRALSSATSGNFVLIDLNP